MVWNQLSVHNIVLLQKAYTINTTNKLSALARLKANIYVHLWYTALLVNIANDVSRNSPEMKMIKLGTIYYNID